MFKTWKTIFTLNTRTEGFGDGSKTPNHVRNLFSKSAGYYDAYFKKAGQVRTLIKQDFDKVFAQYDLIIGPTSPTVAFGIGENIDDPITMYLRVISLTIPVNLAGLTRHVCSWLASQKGYR
jgi:aspartyl-tRNA(Asn)/glutamyl-tRNA(Gln) amidotransferase subunit A